ncbi:MAG: ribosome maturation factor RimM [Flavobacteriales bacterium]|nr:ribosome maturation factor RimM [Flavobacteriales bacterium]
MVDLKVLGTIIRSHGLKGAFKVNIQSAGVPALEKDEPVFIQLQGGPVPFFVEECSFATRDKLIMKIEGVDSLDKAEQMIGKELFLERERFEAPEADASDELFGFEVFDEEKGLIGVVSGVLENPQHPILEISHGEKTILIPWVEAIVKEVDEDARTIHIEAPDGLIDLYVNG